VLDGGVLDGGVLDGGVLSLSKIGHIPVRLHRPLRGIPKTVNISREADGWYASFACAEVPVEPLPLTGRETGIDMGLKGFLVTADGEQVETPRYSCKGEKQLGKAQRRVSCRTKGSKRWWKGVAQCGKQHQTVRRQRTDFHHKTALTLLRQCAVIYLEDLQGGFAGPQPGTDPSPRQKHQRCGVGSVSHYSRRQGSMGRASGDRGACCIYQPGLFGLWGARAEESLATYPYRSLLWAGARPR
jgi:hypothetical protein